MPPSFYNPLDMLCFGHRGARGHAPENTVRAVETAITLGADWVEIDVQAVERELIVIHDDRLERTTNGHGYVAGHGLAELRALDAGEGERIPLLGEVFDAVDRRVGINIELKGPGTAELVAPFVTARLADGWDAAQILVSSFNHRDLELVQTLAPMVATGALLVGLPVTDAAFAEALGAVSVHPSIEFLDARFITDAHRRGLAVYAFTANHEEDIARLATLGVDGVFSDYPERVIRHRQSSM